MILSTKEARENAEAEVGVSTLYAYIGIIHYHDVVEGRREESSRVVDLIRTLSMRAQKCTALYTFILCDCLQQYVYICTVNIKQ